MTLGKATAPKIIIIGAGPVGCFIAYRLSMAGIQVDLFEKGPAIQEHPRATIYYGATQLAYKRAGLYSLIRAEGFVTPGLCWRSLPRDEENGSGAKSLGPIFAKQSLCAPDDKVLECPKGLLSLPQPALTRLFLREALKTGNVTVHYDSELIELDDRGASVVATIHDIRAQTVSQVTGRYLVGADGGKSATRKLLGVGFPGHTWPERLIATDIMFYNHVGHIDPVYPTYQVMGTRYFTFMSPLQTPVPERRTLWRCTIATPADDERTDAELVCDEALYALFDNVLSGPRPLQVEIKQRAVYRIHQRLATTMRRGRCLLAGDAAHVNNPYGAMGVQTGILDGDALADALIMILDEGKPDELLTLWSDARRKVFQYFVDPTTTANLLRLQYPTMEEAVTEDYFFRERQDPSAEALRAEGRPFFETWATDMRALAEEHNV